MIDPDHAIASEKLVSVKPLISHDARTLKDFMNGRSTKSLASRKKKKITDGSSSPTATPTPDISAITTNLIQTIQVYFSRFQTAPRSPP
ncbi:hypothetical protein GQ55_4G147100 [Panicum hallii var. hallii]|uniref:Uncharacterized protein n=1 Tax=Panicum hallii var. hallii TaxID=1504633 RepID=A0A2T7DYC7_9POAL|nr:hypothetical protein GQ55_4G147100 [Panicum hallii var. hallii]